MIMAKMLVEGSGRRIASIDEHIGTAVAGWNPDARQLITRARDECRSYRSNYGEPMPPKTLADRMGGVTHMGSVYWYLRPFGASMLLAGYEPEEKKHELYCVEPTGMALRYFGTAIGKGARAAKTEIEKGKLTDMTCEEALGHVAKILYGVHDETKDKPMEVELSWLSEATGWRHVKVDEERAAAAVAWAKAKIEEEAKGSDDEDEDDDDDE